MTTASAPAQRTIDELAIRNLIARVAQLADEGDLDDYERWFTPDAVWDLPGAPRHGRADIRTGSQERRASGMTGPGSNTRHVLTTIAVQVDGDRATSTAYYQFYAATNAVPRLMVMGKYDDRYVRSPEGWQLNRRTITSG